MRRTQGSPREIDEPQRLRYSLAMRSPDPADAVNPLLRAIERWKRGLAILAIVAIAALSASLVAGIVQLVVGAIVGEAAGLWIGIAALVILTPWLFGQRQLIHMIGKLATLRD